MTPLDSLGELRPILRRSLATLCVAAALATAPATLAQDQPPASPAIPAPATPVPQPATPPAAAQDCMACHGMAKDAAPSIGPNLWNVIGRKAGSADYPYSPAMKAYGQNWTAATLQVFIQSPATVVPGTAMAYAGLPDPAVAKAVVDYLSTLHD
jgi:cytochrome c